jgi:ribulose-5-phosphate 4-epimerase/fuculose-1-phosphate aldolase
MHENTTSDERSSHSAILTALAILRSENVFEKAYGHISVRTQAGDHCCIMRHIHGEERTLDTFSEEDLIVIDLDGHVALGTGEPPGEYPIHTEIYKRRPDVGAIVHCHPKAPVILSIAGRAVLPVSMRGSIFAPEVPVADDPTQIDTPEKGAAVADALGDGRAVVLRGHGVVCVGQSIVEATVTTIDLNENAQLQLAAAAIAEPRVVRAEHIGSDGVIQGLEHEFFSSSWHYHVAKERAGRGLPGSQA